jgi:hypothetical protein
VRPALAVVRDCKALCESIVEVNDPYLEVRYQEEMSTWVDRSRDVGDANK